MAVAFAVSYLCPEWTAKPADEKRNFLRTELSKISIPPGSVPSPAWEGPRPERAVIVQSFRSNTERQELVKFYDQELSKLGWMFLTENQMHMWFKDIGISREYCKGENRAKLSFYSDKSDRNMDYSIELRWTMDTKKQAMREMVTKFGINFVPVCVKQSA
jgi:hypothetical protein